MGKFPRFGQNSSVPWTIIILLTMGQLVRLIMFANVYGGVEHDSGWFLGISRSLAETGRYTTLVSTVADPAPGGRLNIYGQYKVQDEAGRIYFFPESIGPSSIIPNAMIIKLFGPGFWQYRAGPLLFFVIFMLLASYLLYQVGGLLPILITHLFFFFYPHLIIFLGYEAMGEIYSLAYILLAFVLLTTGIRAEKYRWAWFLACGLAAGLTIINKLVGLLSLSGLILVCGLTYWEKRLSFKEVAILIGGWILPPLLWELVQGLQLTLLFDFQTYQGYLTQHVEFFLNEGGSGVGAKSAGGPAFLWYKLLVVKEISLSNDLVGLIVFLLILLSGPFLIWSLYKDTPRRNIVLLLWAGWLIHSLWFIVLSRNGWVRHDWFALMMAVFLLSLITAHFWGCVPDFRKLGQTRGDSGGYLSRPPCFPKFWDAPHFWQQINQSPKWLNRVAAIAITGLLLIGFTGQINTVKFFTADELVDRWYKQHLAANYTRTPWMIIPRSDQEATVAALQQLPASARIFYPEGHKSAEMAVMSGRILYPLQRRPFMPPAEGDSVLIGPSLISRWRKPTETAITEADQEAFIRGVMDQIMRECSHIIFQNEYYLICGIP